MEHGEWTLCRFYFGGRGQSEPTQRRVLGGRGHGEWTDDRGFLGGRGQGELTQRRVLLIWGLGVEHGEATPCNGEGEERVLEAG